MRYLRKGRPFTEAMLQIRGKAVRRIVAISDACAPFPVLAPKYDYQFYRKYWEESLSATPVLCEAKE